MLEIIIGTIAIIFGFWGITRNWYLFKDIVVALIPLVLLAVGTIMMLAGIRGVKKKQSEVGVEK